MRTPNLTARTDATNLLSRLGLAGFLFFLAKGMLWLAVPALAGLLL